MIARCRLLVCLTLILVALGADVARAATQPRPAPRVRIELLSDVKAIPAGGTFWVGVHQLIAEGWHTYWINPGDSGEPARIDWTLPAGFTAGEIAWPHPDRISAGPAMTFGYSREVVLPIPVTAPADLAPGSHVTLRGRVSWVVCEKICIPEEASAALTLPVAAGPASPDPRGAPMIAAARRAGPTPSPWPASFTATAEAVTFTIGARDLDAARVADIWFYPMRWGAIEHAAPQRARFDASGVTLDVARGQLADAVKAPIDGVLIVAEKLDGGVARHAFSVRAHPRDALSAASASSLSLAVAIALALAGGVVLNLMPCVLPVLSVKALSLVQHASGERRVLRYHGLAYTAGVLGCFALIGGVLVALRAGGEQIGWGFQLQSPVFVTLLAYVFFVMALSLSGVLIIATRFAGAGHGLASRAGYAGSFSTGLLATVAATPCTAPFMGPAVGFAVTQSPATALLVFEALGLGLALPYLALTFVPGWRRYLPKPGAWMERLKQLLAFPLYASAAWLVWVVSRQAGPEGLAVALAGLVLIAFAVWLRHVSRESRTKWRRGATAIAVTLVVAAVALASLMEMGAPIWPPNPQTLGRRGVATASSTAWERFSPKRLADLRAAGTPVLVNFTAAWCITCLVNERVALRSAAVTEALARKNVVALKADWTKQDPVITGVLGTFGRNGVPLYLFYPARRAGGAVADPVVLPQILSEGTVIDAIQ